MQGEIYEPSEKRLPKSPLDILNVRDNESGQLTVFLEKDMVYLSNYYAQNVENCV